MYKLSKDTLHDGLSASQHIMWLLKLRVTCILSDLFEGLKKRQFIEITINEWFNCYAFFVLLTPVSTIGRHDVANLHTNHFNLVGSHKWCDIIIHTDFATNIKFLKQGQGIHQVVGQLNKEHNMRVQQICVRVHEGGKKPNKQKKWTEWFNRTVLIGRGCPNGESLLMGISSSG